MKAHSPILREFAITERKRGAKISEIAVRLKLPSGTVKAWLFRGHATSRATGQWMQSLHHDSAHFILNGIPACSNADNGAKIVPGMAWLPHDGCVRKCKRCMRHAENEKAQTRAQLNKPMANTPPPVTCSRCGEPYSSFSHRCGAAKEEAKARRSAAACSSVGGEFYQGIEWLACWLLDQAEGETITEEQLRPWAQKAWLAHLDRKNEIAQTRA